MTPENTLNEFFDFFDRGENAVQVIPVTVKEQEDDTRLCIFIHGEHQTSSTLFACLMEKVEELYAIAAQMEEEQSESKRIIS